MSSGVRHAQTVPFVLGRLLHALQETNTELTKQLERALDERVQDLTRRPNCTLKRAVEDTEQARKHSSNCVRGATGVSVWEVQPLRMRCGSFVGRLWPVRSRAR